MKHFLRETIRRCNLYWAHRKGLKAGRGVHLSLQGKLDIASTACVKFADSVSIFKSYRIEAGEGAIISLGTGVHFREGARLYAGKNAKIIIDAGCYFNHDVSIVALEAVTIGKDSIFGPYCYVSDNNHGFDKGVLIKKQKQQTRPVSIGSDVWLGVGATLLKGGRIGDGAVVGARSVVTKEVPDNEIWAGIPARRLSCRQTD